MGIVALWTHPRAISTAFERSTAERGDFEVLHEPFCDIFYPFRRDGQGALLTVSDNRCARYREIRSALLSKGLLTDLFFKDMAFHALAYMIDDDEFLASIKHTVLFRDPYFAVRSHYALNVNVTVEELGYHALLALVERLGDRCHATITAERLLAEPAKTIAQYWNSLGRRATGRELEWQPGFLNSWKPWDQWHERTAATSGFLPPTLQERTPLVGRVRELYAEVAPVYSRLLECTAAIRSRNQ